MNATATMTTARRIVITVLSMITPWTHQNRYRLFDEQHVFLIQVGTSSLVLVLEQQLLKVQQQISSLLLLQLPCALLLPCSLVLHGALSLNQVYVHSC